MAVTRITRKKLRRKLAARRKKDILKFLTAKPILTKKQEGKAA
ncbi:MAG: hypothetical protein AAF900_01975 [Bacteroidota bacterium]